MDRFHEERKFVEEHVGRARCEEFGRLLAYQFIDDVKKHGTPMELLSDPMFDIVSKHLEKKQTEIKEFEEQLPNLKGDAELEVKEKISILQQENEGYEEEINRYNAWHSDIEYR